MIPKFRAWDKDEKYFITEATIVLDKDGSVEEIEYYHTKLGHSVYNDISYYELLQSTGLKDKNGVEIFEGDVVKNNYDEIGRIRWFKGSFDFCDTEGEAFYLFSMGAAQPFEILGNIYEHPYLLEE